MFCYIFNQADEVTFKLKICFTQLIRQVKFRDDWTALHSTLLWQVNWEIYLSHHTAYCSVTASATQKQSTKTKRERHVKQTYKSIIFYENIINAASKKYTFFFFFKEKGEKSTPPLGNTMRTYKGCTHLLCVNGMPGYFEDHDTTETKKSSKCHIGQEQRHNDYLTPGIQQTQSKRE